MTLPTGWKFADEEPAKPALPEGWRFDPGNVGGVVNATRRAGRASLAGLDVMHALGASAKRDDYLREVDRLEKQAGEIDTLQPDWTPENRQMWAERARATAGELRKRADSMQESQTGAIAGAAGQMKKAGEIPLSEDYEKYQKASGWDAVRQFLKNPVEIPATIAAEGLAGSVPALVAGAAGAATAGVPGMAAGAGIGSYTSEFASSLLDTFDEAGVSIDDPKALQQAFGNAELMAQARKRGVARGIPVAIFDAISGGLAGRTVAPVVRQGVKQIAKAGAKEIAEQAGLGMLGETAGQASEQVATTGRIDPSKFKLGDIAAEGIGEIVPGSVEIGVGASRRALDTGKNVPESKQTLIAQQEQLLAGRRPAQMFPVGTEELPLPDGLKRVETPRGVFHFNPQIVTEDDILTASKAGRENDVLAMGPVSKADTDARAGAGEPRVAVTERTPEGAEVKTVSATAGTAPTIAASLESSKTPKNTVQTEPLGKTLTQRSQDFVGDMMKMDAEKIRASEESQATERATRENRQKELDAKKTRFDETVQAARSIAQDSEATFPAVNGALQAVRFYAEDNSVGLTEPQREQARRATAVLEQMAAKIKPFWDAKKGEEQAKAAADQLATATAQKAVRSDARKDFKAEVAAGVGATGAFDYESAPMTALEARATTGDQKAIDAIARRSETAEVNRGKGDPLLKVLARVKLPSSDKTLSGELADLIREGMTPRQRMELLSGEPGSLDGLAESLRVDHGFSWIQTPSDVIDAVQRALRGEDVRADWANPDNIAFANGAKRPKAPALTDQQAEKEMTAIRKAFPDLTREYDIEVGLVEDAMRARGYQGQVPAGVQAAVLRLKAQRSLIVLGARAYRDRAKGAALLTHEVAHTYWNTLPDETRQQLRILHARETADKTGPLYQDGKLKSELDFIEEQSDRGAQEWFAERIARLNEAWALGRIDRTEHSLLVRIAHQVREFLRRIWTSIAERQGVDPEGDLFVQEFRRFFSAGADAEIGHAAGTAYAQAQGLLELESPLGITLPDEIRNLTPRWQAKAIRFASALDKALYYAQGEGHTAVRDRIITSLSQQTGLTPGQIAALARTLRERIGTHARATADPTTIRLPELMSEDVTKLTGSKFARKRIDKSAKPVDSSASERAAQYVAKNGTAQEKRAAAEADIARLLAVAEDEQLDLFGYGEPAEEVPAGRGQEQRPIRPDRLTEQQRAADALTDPANPEKLRAGFGEGTRISSIIPELVRNPAKTWDIRGAVIKTARDFATFVQMMRTPYVETCKLVFLNASNEVVHSEIVSVGALSEALLAPSILARVTGSLPNAGKGLSVIVSHNHPSGDPNPSAADLTVTRQWDHAAQVVGIKLLDHVITNGESYFSFREGGHLRTEAAGKVSRVKPKAIGADVAQAKPLGEKAPWEIVKRTDLRKTESVDFVKTVFSTLRQVTPNALHVLYVNRKMFLTAIERIPNFTGTLEELKRHVFTTGGREGATALFIGLPDNIGPDVGRTLIASMREFTKATGMEVIDVSAPGWLPDQTARQAGLMEGQAQFATGADDESRKQYDAQRPEFDRLTARVDQLKQEIADLVNSQELDIEARGRELNAELQRTEAQAKALYATLEELRSKWDKGIPELGTRVESLPKVDRQAALIAELKRGRAMRDEGIKTGNEKATQHGTALVRQATERLDDEFPGWDKQRQTTNQGQRPANDAIATQPGPQPDDAEASPFTPDSEMPVRRNLLATAFGHGAYEPNFLAKGWRHLRTFFQGFKSAIPELPTFPAAWWNRSDDFTRKLGAAFYNPVREFLRTLRAGNDYVQRTAEERLTKIISPLMRAGGKFAANDYARLRERQEQIRRAQVENKKVAPGVLAEVDALNSELEAHPYVLFNKLVYFLDLHWRHQNLRENEEAGFKLPGGLNIAEVNHELKRLSERLEASPHAEMVKAAVREHMALVSEIAADLKGRDLFPGEELTNPYYFPHVTLEKLDAGGKTEQRELRPERIKPGTEQDFRGYLIDPVGSEKAIESDYVRAMYYHLVQVGSHNWKADAVRDVRRVYDVKKEADELAKKLSKQRGHPVTWLQAFHEHFAPQGYVTMGMEDDNPFGMITVNRDALARRLGVMLTNDDIHEQLQALGLKGIKLLPEDLQETLVMGNKEVWIVPARVAEALKGIARREDQQDMPMGAAAKWTLGIWKSWKLFMPQSHVRYEFNNVVADLEKITSAAPRTFKFMPEAAKEVRQFWMGGDPTDDLRAALKEGVINAVTAQELGALQRLPQFRDFETWEKRFGSELKAAISAPLTNLTRLAGDGLLGRVNSVEQSAFREAVFRYAKFKSDIHALRNNSRPQYAGAYWKTIDAMTDSAPGADDANERKAGAIAKATFVDYGDLSVGGQWLRDKLVPFYSWIEGNFKYHANLFRNLRDMVRAGEASQTEAAKAGTRAAAVFAAGFSARVAGGLLLRLAVPYLAVYAWNNSGDRDDLEKLLSDEDRRRFHIILGKNPDGTVNVTYAQTALADLIKWFSGPKFLQAMAGWMNGKTDFPTAFSEWRDDLVPDAINNVAQGLTPWLKLPYMIVSKKQTFPDVLDQRTIPAYDMRRAILSQITDDFTADQIEKSVNKEYYATKDLGDHVKQMILQVRKRDPEQWAFYEVKDKAADFLERMTGKRRGGSDYQSPEQQVLRNFRRAIYRGDTDKAVQFYLALLDYGYTAERFVSSIRAQDPLSELPKENGLRDRFVKGLAPDERQQLQRAYEFYNRLAASRGREAALFPREAWGARGTRAYQQQPRIQELRRSMDRVGSMDEEERLKKADRALRESLRIRR